jgi:uncharacterized protein (DUF1330 family)
MPAQCSAGSRCQAGDTLSARPDVQQVHRDAIYRKKSTMTAYLISDVGAVAAEDRSAWEAYLALAPATIEQYGGRYLARGGQIDVIEGAWSPHAVVVAEFPDGEAVRRWYASPEYSEALKIRAASSLHRNMICVEGTVDGSSQDLLRPSTE